MSLFSVFVWYNEYMNNAPLAESLRPKMLSEFVGQTHIVGDGKIITQLLQKATITHFFPSLIFWGPPGTGKTTLARIISKELDREFYEFSAVSASSKDIQNVIPKNRETSQLFAPPIVFLDEIHRFNKAQQDKLLPHVERGDIILIGATTENPSFEVNNALLSRSRVVVLKQLEETDFKTLIKRAEKEIGKTLQKKAKEFLIHAAAGDARILLNTIEISAQLADRTIGLKDIEDALQKRAIGFDKQGDNHYNTISAFIKSMRASNTDSAMYYLARMIEAGEDPLFIARRMVIFASEDIGMAAPTALVVANAVFRACETIGYPECSINLAHGVAYLCNAKKNRASYDALRAAQADVNTFGNLPIPKKILNAPTKLMKDEGYGEGYEPYTKEDLLPEKLKNKKYYKG